MVTKIGYPKGISYEQRYGMERAMEIKKKLSIVGKNKIYSPEQKQMYKEVQARVSKGKTAEERFGVEKAELIKQKISIATKLALSKPEVSAKISAWQLGRTMPRAVVEKRARTMKERGYKHSTETKNKIGKANAISLLGKKQSPELIEKRRLKLIGHKCPEHVKQALIKSRANQIFPKTDTTIEIKMQNYLKQLGVEFYTHQYIKEIEHKYQCDILIPSKKLIIEVDGNYWHNYPYGNEIDLIRNKELRDKGYKILRFWELEIRPMELEYLQNKLIQMGVKNGYGSNR